MRDLSDLEVSLQHLVSIRGATCLCMRPAADAPSRSLKVTGGSRARSKKASPSGIPFSTILQPGPASPGTFHLRVITISWGANPATCATCE